MTVKNHAGNRFRNRESNRVGNTVGNRVTRYQIPEVLLTVGFGVSGYSFHPSHGELASRLATIAATGIHSPVPTMDDRFAEFGGGRR